MAALGTWGEKHGLKRGASTPPASSARCETPLFDSNDLQMAGVGGVVEKSIKWKEISYLPLQIVSFQISGFVKNCPEFEKSLL